MDPGLKDIDHVLDQEIKTNKTPSVVYYLFNADIVIKSIYLGCADLSTNKKADEQTFYKAFSGTKTFTAISVMQLTEQKIINLNDPIKKYLPGFIYGGNITIKQVLSHSAGIPNPIPLNWIHTVEEHPEFDRDKFFESIFLKHPKASHAPNEKFIYSNLGYFILGQLIEKVAGLKYEAYVEKNIISKLGLDNSALSFTINEKNAIGYNKKLSFTNLVIGWFIDKSKYMRPSIGKWKPYVYFYPDGASYGGLIGMPVSFVKYLQSLLKNNSALLADEFKQQMFTENLNNKNERTGMCLGWFTDNLNGIRYVAHPGGGGGYYCEFRIYPDKGIGSLVFFNRTGMSNEKFLDRLDKYYFVSDKLTH